MGTDHVNQTASGHAATIRQATTDDAATVATLTGELLAEIMTVTGQPHFEFDLAATTARLAEWLADDRYLVWLAEEDRAGEATQGFVAATPTRAAYAGGEFGLVPECYVRPVARSSGAGRKLLDAVAAYGRAHGWTRLEVTTPPLPAFDRTLAFYEREGFAIAGGHKLRKPL